MNALSAGKPDESAEMMASPGAVRFGSTRPSREGPRLLKFETWSRIAPDRVRSVSFTSTHCVLLTCEPTQMIRRAVAGIPMVLLPAPPRKYKRIPGGTPGGRKNEPASDHMSNVPVPYV